MLKRKQREEGDAGIPWVLAVILNQSVIDEPALLEMEQREQLTANFKVRYNDIDYLLALREAAVLRDIDFDDPQSIETVAGELHTMVEKSTAEVARDLYAIKYMDRFLDDSGAPGEYHRVLRTLERFRDIGRMMMTVEEDYILDAADVLQVLFAAVRAGRPHGDIRAIRRMFRNERERFDDLADKIATAEDGWEPEANGLSSPSVTAPVRDDDEEDEEDAPAPQVSNYPKSEVGSAIDVAIDGFNASRQHDILQIAREILNRLEILADRLQRPVDEAELDEALNAIVTWFDRNRSLLTDD
jgi:type VI protein secretion system component VasF